MNDWKNKSIIIINKCKITDELVKYDTIIENRRNLEEQDNVTR